jgi:hypothetical protein
MTDHASACPAEVGKGERREAEPSIAQVDGSGVETAKSPRIGDCWEFGEELAERNGFGRPCRGEDQIDVVGRARARKLVHASNGHQRPPSNVRKR